MYEFWPNALANSAFGVCVIFVLFIIPLIVLMYCYGRILWVLTRRIDSDLENSTNDKFQLARTNTIKTFLMVGICFIMCWSNNQIYFLMHNLGYEINWNGTYYLFTVLMVFLNCTVNPFIYLIKYRDYQEALKKLFHCHKKKSLEESETKSSTVSLSGESSGIFTLGKPANDTPYPSPSKENLVSNNCLGKRRFI